MSEAYIPVYDGHCDFDHIKISISVNYLQISIVNTEHFNDLSTVLWFKRFYFIIKNSTSAIFE